jgi:signal transduction histidine kinase
MRKDFEILTYEIGEPRDLGEVCREAAGNWIHPDERDRFLKEISLDYVREQLGSADGFTRRYKGVKKDGTSCWKQIKMSYMDELMDWIMVEQTDITKEARIQEMLENQLEREKELRQMADRANEMKTGFLASVSHDMRTPLNAVLGYAALADEGSDLKNIKDYLSKIQMAGNMLLLLINDTLDLQKMESGIVTLKPEPVRIRDLIECVATAVQPDMDKKKIGFQVSSVYEDDRYVAADLVRVEKILINLLANAVKYTPEQGTVLFHTETSCKTSDTVSLRAKVRDNGLGISKGFLPRIYEPFSQERTEETEHIDGSGLGLSIVKRLVDLMDGTITVSSELGKGTEFCVELDFPRIMTEKIPVKQPENMDEQILEGKKVLLCEDNLMNQEIMEAMLKKYGLEVICASNGKDGTIFFEKSAPGEFGAILMDIHMPVMDGYQATEKIRNSRHPDAQKIPIIAMTADAYQEDVQKAFEMGMNAHLAKPVNPKLLYLELKKQIMS